MPIDHFTYEQFEAALPQGTHGPLYIVQGVTDGEHAYRMPVKAFNHNGGVYVAIRSSVREDGQSAGVGEDSIRLYLMCPTGPVASKLTKYITRVKGWERRMTTQLRTLYKIGLALKPCPQCGDLMHGFIAKGPLVLVQNRGRLFQKCVRVNARGLKLHGCSGSFEWIEFKEASK